MIDWNQVKTAADWMQENLCQEPVTWNHYPEVAVDPDTPLEEPATDPLPTDLSLTSGVRESGRDAEIKAWGQEIGADYILVFSAAVMVSAGLNPGNDTNRGFMMNDTVSVRGNTCTILRIRMTGWTGSEWIWCTVAVRKET